MEFAEQIIIIIIIVVSRSCKGANNYDWSKLNLKGNYVDEIICNFINLQRETGILAGYIQNSCMVK